MKVERVSTKSSSKGTRVIVHFNFAVTPERMAYHSRQVWKNVHHTYDGEAEAAKASRAFVKLVNEMAAGGLEKDLLEALAVTASMHVELKKEGM